MPDANSCDEVALRDIRGILGDLDKVTMTELRSIIVKHRVAAKQESERVLAQVLDAVERDATYVRALVNGRSK